MPAPKKSMRPKARPGKAKMKKMVEAGEQDKRDGEALKRALKYRAKGGKMKMVEKGGKKVPAFAADGVGKMAYGGKAKVKKMKDGGMCRGMGAATRGGNYKMG